MVQGLEDGMEYRGKGERSGCAKMREVASAFEDTIFGVEGYTVILRGRAWRSECCVNIIV